LSLLLIIVGIIVLSLALLCLPLTFLLNLEFDDFSEEEIGDVGMEIRYAGIRIYKKRADLAVEDLFQNIKGWSEIYKTGEDKWGVWLWRQRAILWKCLGWYRLCVLSPPVRIVANYGVSDPAKTGMICGYLAAISGCLPSRLVEFIHSPDFVTRRDHIYGKARVSVIPLLAIFISFLILIRLLPLIIEKYSNKPSVQETIPV
jgi:hypothetical protein